MIEKIEKVKVGELEFEVKEVKMLVRKGRGVWLMVGINGKDGKLRKYVMRGVDKWLGEESVGGEEWE